MLRVRSRLIRAGVHGAALALALALTSGVLLLAKASPAAAYREILVGAFGSKANLAYVLRAAVPLWLATAGVLITFAAGLWNIGVEGQIMIGAVFATGALRALQDAPSPGGVAIAAGLFAGVVGGLVWGALAGGLKTFAGVHEIFGGLGLNFVATAVTLWLIFGPWKRPGVGSMSGTQPFPERLWMAEVGPYHVSPAAVALAAAGVAAVWMLLGNSRFGLRLKAVGRNPAAAFRLGIPASRYVLWAFVLCGALAGLAGALQVTGVYHRLIPSISSGYGFLALLVAMLVGYRAAWAVPVAFFFAALSVGGIQLPISLQLDSSLAGVLQGALVLFVVLASGVRQRWLAVPSGTDAPAAEADAAQPAGHAERNPGISSDP